MFQKRGNIIVTIILALIFALAIGGFAQVSAVESSKKALTVALIGEPDTLDPPFATGRLSQTLLQNVYDSLTWHDEEMRLRPGLATSWEPVGERTWRFKLRKGVKFHNGEEFNAEAVKFSLDRTIDPKEKAYARIRVGDIEEVKVIDPYTVDVITRTPDILLPTRLSELYGSIVPPKYIKEVGKEGFRRHPIGTGPFKFVKWVKNEYLILEANEDYWRGAPQIKTLTLRPIIEDATRMGALLTGEVDIGMNVPAFRVADLEASGKVRVEIVSSTRFYFVVIDTTKFPFSDKRVRQALNYAVDVQALINAVHRGHGTRLATVVIPQAFGYDPSVEPYPYDPEKAKKLLAEAGYPNGFETVFDSFTGAIIDHSQVAEAIVGQLEKVGVRAKLNVTEFGVFSPIRIANKTNPLYIYSFGEWALDADNTFGLFLLDKPKGGYYYTNPELYAKLLEERATFDPKKRAALLSELQKTFKEEAPFIFLYQVPAIWGMRKDVEYKPRTDEMLWFYTASFK